MQRQSLDVADLASLAGRRLPMPDVSGLQIHCVRYANSPHSVPGQWEASRSQGAPEPLPTAMRLSLVEAPSEWTWPIRLGRCFRPGFKLCLEIAHSSLLVLPISLQAHLLSEEEMEQLLSWNPPLPSAAPGSRSSGVKGSSQGPTAALCGTVTRSAIVEAGKLNNAWCSSTPVKTARQTNSDPTSQQAAAPATVGWPSPTTADGQAQRLLAMSPGLELTADSGSLAKGPAQGNGAASKRTSLPDGFTGPDDGQARNGQTDKATMLSREEFVFSDLKFSKPSRMSPVYIAFTCTLLATGDKMVVVYNTPTVCTCRAEQWAPACARLNLPDTLNGVSDGMHSSNPTASDPTAPQLAQQHAQGGWHGQVGPQAPSQPSTAQSALQHRISDSSASMQIAHQQALMNQHAAANGHIDPSTSSSGTPSSASIQLHMQLQQQQMLANSLPIEAKDVMEWCAEAFAGMGLVRTLSQEDLQALAIMSAVPAATTPQQSREAFERFRHQFQACLSFMRHVPGLWNRQSPYVVAGFAVNREVASRRLASEPVGTFLCRLSCSSTAGGLALAVRVAPGHPHGGPDNVLHVLITKADIEQKPVQTILRDYTGTTHLLDVYTGKRMDKRKVFASDYMRLGDIIQSKRRVELSRLGNGGASAELEGSMARDSVMDIPDDSPSNSTEREASSETTTSSISASPPGPRAGAGGTPPPQEQLLPSQPSVHLAPQAPVPVPPPRHLVSHCPDQLMMSTDPLLPSAAQLQECDLMTGGASNLGARASQAGPTHGGPNHGHPNQMMPSMSQMLMDSSQMDVAALLDSMVQQGGVPHEMDAHMMFNSKSHLFNTEEQTAMLAAALLGPD